MIAHHPEWPELPLEEWEDTYHTLHLWTQIVGKIRLGLALLGGFLAEAGIFAVMPIVLQFGSQTPLYVIPPTCLVRATG